MHREPRHLVDRTGFAISYSTASDVTSGRGRLVASCEKDPSHHVVPSMRMVKGNVLIHGLKLEVVSHAGFIEYRPDLVLGKPVVTDTQGCGAVVERRMAYKVDDEEAASRLQAL